MRGEGGSGGNHRCMAFERSMLPMPCSREAVTRHGHTSMDRLLDSLHSIEHSTDTIPLALE